MLFLKIPIQNYYFYKIKRKIKYVEVSLEIIRHNNIEGNLKIYYFLKGEKKKLKFISNIKFQPKHNNLGNTGEFFSISLM